MGGFVCAGNKSLPGLPHREEFSAHTSNDVAA